MPELIDPRHERFCHEYIVARRGKKSAIAAGYPASSANKAATRLLARPEVKARIEELQAAAIARANLSKDEVIEGLRKAAALLDANENAKKGTAGASVRALELLGKEIGMFKDTLTIEHHNMSDDTLIEKLAEANPQVAELVGRLLRESSPLPTPANVIPIASKAR